MTGPWTRAKILLALLAVTAVSGVAAGTASATITTGFTCASITAGGGFSDSHCANKVTDGASFYHSSFTGSTGITITNASGTSTEFKAPIASTQVTVTCTGVVGKGTIENYPGGAGVEMGAWGTTELNFGGCAVVGPPGCTVSGGGFATKPLKFGAGDSVMALNVFPATPSVLAEVVIDGCNSPAFNRTWVIEGLISFTPHGTTLISTHKEVTTAQSLTAGAVFAGFASSLIITGPSGAGIAFTT